MKSFNTFIAEEKKATITKKESYRGRTTADVEYNVHDENGRHIRTTKTKKEAKMWKDMHELSKEEMHKKYPELVPKLNEAAYAGNIGIMELIKFKQKATPEQKKKFDDHVKNKRTKDAWDMVQKVTGVQLHKSVHEEKKSPNPDILPPAGAGQEGTDLLVKRYKRDTPGQ